MAEFQVTCINKKDRSSSHEAISHIGNQEQKWRLSRKEAVRRIESKEASFFTVDRTTGRKMYVGVVRENGKEPYLRTHADGKWNDNLLAQPECDSSCKIVG